MSLAAPSSGGGTKNKKSMVSFAVPDDDVPANPTSAVVNSRSTLRNICLHSGCDDIILKSGYCEGHYREVYGEPNMDDDSRDSIQAHLSLVENLKSKFESIARRDSMAADDKRRPNPNRKSRLLIRELLLKNFGEDSPIFDELESARENNGSVSTTTEDEDAELDDPNCPFRRVSKLASAGGDQSLANAVATLNSERNAEAIEEGDGGDEFEERGEDAAEDDTSDADGAAPPAIAIEMQPDRSDSFALSESSSNDKELEESPFLNQFFQEENGWIVLWESEQRWLGCCNPVTGKMYLQRVPAGDVTSDTTWDFLSAACGSGEPVQLFVDGSSSHLTTALGDKVRLIPLDRELWLQAVGYLPFVQKVLGQALGESTQQPLWTYDVYKEWPRISSRQAFSRLLLISQALNESRDLSLQLLAIHNVNVDVMWPQQTDMEWVSTENELGDILLGAANMTGNLEPPREGGRASALNIVNALSIRKSVLVEKLEEKGEESSEEQSKETNEKPAKGTDETKRLDTNEDQNGRKYDVVEPLPKPQTNVRPVSLPPPKKGILKSPSLADVNNDSTSADGNGLDEEEESKESRRPRTVRLNTIAESPRARSSTTDSGSRRATLKPKSIGFSSDEMPSSLSPKAAALLEATATVEREQELEGGDEGNSEDELEESFQTRRSRRRSTTVRIENYNDAIVAAEKAYPPKQKSNSMWDVIRGRLLSLKTTDEIKNAAGRVSFWRPRRRSRSADLANDIIAIGEEGAVETRGRARSRSADARPQKPMVEIDFSQYDQRAVNILTTLQNENVSPAWRSVFDRSGIKPQDLRDSSMVEFVLETITHFMDKLDVCETGNEDEGQVASSLDRCHRVKTASSVGGRPIRESIAKEIKKEKSFRNNMIDYPLPNYAHQFHGKSYSYHFDEADSPSNIVFSGAKEIVAANLNKLVERLTYDKSAGPNFAFVFLLTYRTFTTPGKLLKKLIRRYYVPVPPNITPKEIELFKSTKLSIIQLRVVNILKQWVTSHFYDFDNDPALCDSLMNFASDVIMKNKRLAPHAKIIISRLKDGPPKGGDNVWTGKTPPPPMIPRNLDSFFTVQDVSEVEVARQLTLIEFALFKKIEPKECLNQSWAKHKEQAPNILAMIARFNKVSRWVGTEVLKHSTEKARGNCIKRFIKIADECRALHNYNCVVEIISGLNSASIHRLKRSWANVDNRRIELFRSFETLMSNKQNYKEMRKALHEAPTPCVPYLGIFLTDLTFIEDGNRDETHDLINFDKRKKIAKVIQDIHSYQAGVYNIEPVPKLLEYFGDLSTIPDQELHKLSLKREPRQPQPG